MASIRDVAKRANVAACTVSRVLNGTANVAPETRMKIEQAMKELNYIPNELARSMFKQKAGIVAMLVPDIRHPYFSSLARHIEDELYKNDCKLMLCSTGDDPEREKESFCQGKMSGGVKALWSGSRYPGKISVSAIRRHDAARSDLHSGDGNTETRHCGRADTWTSHGGGNARHGAFPGDGG